MPDQPCPDLDGRSVPRGFPYTLHLGFGVVGLALVLGNQRATRVAARVVPKSFTVEGRGTPFGSFSELGPAVFHRIGLAVIAAAVISAGLQLSGRATNSAARAATAGPTPSKLLIASRYAVVFGAPFALVLYLSSPHNAFTSNSRIHWVDYLTRSSDVFFYAAGRVPHFLFYDHPSLWHAINAGLLALTVDALLRRLGFGRLSAGLLMSAFFSSAMVMLFVDTGEDVLLNFLLLSLFLLSLTTTRSWCRGLALGAVVLGRPEFLSMLGAYGAAVAVDVFLARRGGNDAEQPMRAAFRGHAAVYGWAIGFIALSQTVFTIFGERYLFTRGRIVDLGVLDLAEPNNVDGFTIAPLSGAYIGHFLWVLPLGLIVATACYLPRIVTDRPTRGSVHDTRRLVAAVCVAAVALTLLLHELKPLLYFNVRYLSYNYPFLFVAGIIATADLARRHPSSRGFLWPLVALTLVAVPTHPLDAKERREQRAEVALFGDMDTLQRSLGARDVLVAYEGSGVRNALAYVFRTDVERIVMVTPEEVQAAVDSDKDVIVIARRGELDDVAAEGQTLVSTAQLVVFRIGR